MSRRFLYVPLSVMLMAGSAAAVTYFPSDAGPVFEYTSGEVTIGGGPVSFTRAHVTGSGTFWFSSFERFAVTEGGDVLKAEEGGGCSACPDPDITYFDPPYLLLDFPLTAGKTWRSDTMTTALWGYEDPVPVTVIGTVVGPATVTVPAGTFEVMQVRIVRQCVQKPQLNRDFVYWLHPQLGPVEGLVSWEGVVPDAPSTWGGVKALYR